MESFTMYFPDSFEEACSLLTEHETKVISGGTALTTMMKERIFQPESLINIRGLQTEHAYVERENNMIRIGALTTLREIETNSLVRETVPVIAETLSEVASIRVRNVATIGGNIAHSDPDLDLPPVLAGLGAEIVIHGPDGERSEDITDFIKGYYETDLAPNELVKEIRVPIIAGHSATYIKHRSLSEADWPCVGVTAQLGPETNGTPVVYMNSVADTPIFCIDGLEEVFAEGITDESIEAAGDLAKEQCDPIGDARGSAWYKRRMAKEITQRAIRQVTEKHNA